MKKKNKGKKDKEVKDVPMTSIIRHRVREGREADYAEWSKGIAKTCKLFTGYTGTKIIQPAEPGEEFVILITFDHYENYQRWQDSPERMVWLHKLRDIMEGEVSREFIRGFEYWLGNDADEGRSWPPDFRMIIIAYVAIWPVVYFVVPNVVPFLPVEPILASLASTAVVTLLMGYISLPLVTRIAKRWLIKN